jgi:hypothetical protein
VKAHSDGEGHGATFTVRLPAAASAGAVSGSQSNDRDFVAS